MGLTRKQRAFVDEYLIDFNATQAAIRAGYSQKTARSIGHRLLTNVDVDEEIRLRVSERAMTANEALIRLAEQARGGHADYIRRNGVDLGAMVEAGKTHLIKSIKQTAHGTNIEFYDSQAALFKILQLVGMPDEPDDDKGEEPQVVVYIPDNGRGDRGADAHEADIDAGEDNA